MLSTLFDHDCALSVIFLKKNELTFSRLRREGKQYIKERYCGIYFIGAPVSKSHLQTKTQKKLDQKSFLLFLRQVFFVVQAIDRLICSNSRHLAAKIDNNYTTSRIGF